MTLYLLIALLVGAAAWMGYNFWRVRQAAKNLSNEEFAQKMHGAQIVDVRPPVQFDYKHIIGARNFPVQQLKQLMPALRKDKPVLLYENKRGSAVINAALQLKKAGYQEIYILSYGLDYWDGKVKRGR